jgi:serine O-acetyltransferase
LNEYLHNSNKNFLLRVIPKWYFKRISIRLGFSIPLNVFDEGLAVVHYGTVIVSPSAIVGKNCRIHAGVNIGGVGGRAAVDRGDRIAPIIGDDCYLGPGAKIYGPIDIGNRCVIGANAVVGRSFGSDNLTIAGVPARVIVSRDVEGDSGNVLDQVESAGRE